MPKPDLRGTIQTTMIRPDADRRTGYISASMAPASQQTTEATVRDYQTLYFAVSFGDWTSSGLLALNEAYERGWDDGRIQRAIDAGIAAGWLDPLPSV